MEICCMTQGTQTEVLKQSKWNGKGWEVGRRFKREGTYVHLWLIHVGVRQKSNQYCKAIILQLKNLKKKEFYSLKIVKM